MEQISLGLSDTETPLTYTEWKDELRANSFRDLYVHLYIKRNSKDFEIDIYKVHCATERLSLVLGFAEGVSKKWALTGRLSIEDGARGAQRVYVGGKLIAVFQRNTTRLSIELPKCASQKLYEFLGELKDSLADHKEQ